MKVRLVLGETNCKTKGVKPDRNVSVEPLQGEAKWFSCDTCAQHNPKKKK